MLGASPTIVTAPPILLKINNETKNGRGDKSNSLHSLMVIGDTNSKFVIFPELLNK
jgi:hypothetical protein